MGREDDGAVIGAVVQILDEHGPLVAQAVDDEFIMHDFMADIDGRAEFLDRHFHHLDRTIHPGTKAARGGEMDGEGRFRAHGDAPARGMNSV